ncbi:MAG: NAD-dependent epimerase/dehydratase family protein [Synechococcus sp.]
MSASHPPSECQKVPSVAGQTCMVLGGGGFIGTALCQRLLREGAKVKAFGRSRSFPDLLAGVPFIRGDFADVSKLAQVLEQTDIVFHAISTTTPAASNINKVDDAQTNLLSTLHLLESCRELGVSKIVFLSTGGGIYGPGVDVPTPENADTSPICSYGIIKLAIEKYLNLFHHLYNLDYTILRLSNPFGIGQHSRKNQGVVAAFLKQAVLGQPLTIWGDGEVVRDFIFIDDVIDALVRAATYRGQHRIFNIGSGEGRSINEVVACIKTLLGSPIKCTYKPGRSADVSKSILDVTLAKQELRWQPQTPFDIGLERTYRWLLEQHRQGLLEK